MQGLSSTVRPEEAGVSSAGILSWLDAVAEAGLEHHALWVLRHGQVAAKINFAPYNDHTPHMLFSLSKSFCSAAAGFAVQEGLLRWETKLIDVLPEKFPEAPSEWLQAITLHDLLIMGSGLKPESDNVDGEDWAEAVLACGCDHAPGTHFHYNSHGTYLVSCMVQKVTGQTCRDYLVPRLFEPLGMMNEDGTPPEWDCCPAGINVGGWGLWLSCAQIARFGQCLLQKGVWDGKQVLPPEWFARATVRQIDNSNGENPNPQHDWSLGYGYQFWMCRGNRFRGDGMFAQLCVVDEKRDMVVCCVSGIHDIGKALDLIYRHLFAAADMEPASPEVQEALQQRLAGLAYPWPEHDGSPLPIGVYRKDDKAVTIEADRVILPLSGGKTCLFYPGRPEIDGDVAACCGMQDGVLRMLARPLRAPFTLDITMRFSGSSAEVTLAGVGPEKTTAILQKD